MSLYKIILQENTKKSPIWIHNGNFHCSNNQLTSLEGAPNEVDGHFDCSHNELTSLEGAPSHVGGDFDCYKNQLTSLEGAPIHVSGYFDCSRNPNVSKEEILKYKETGAVKGTIYSNYGIF